MYLTLSINDTQHNNVLHHAEFRYAECRYAECRYAEWMSWRRFRGLSIIVELSATHNLPIRAQFYKASIPSKLVQASAFDIYETFIPLCHIYKQNGESPALIS